MKRAPIIKSRNINDTRLLINGPELYRVVIAYQRYCPNRHLLPKFPTPHRNWTGLFSCPFTKPLKTSIPVHNSKNY